MSRARLEAIEATLRAVLAQVEALKVEAERPDRPALLDLKQAHEIFGVSRFALLAAQERGELSLHRGPHQRILVDRDALEAWLRSKPHIRRPRKVEPTKDLEEWEGQADQVLRAVAGPRGR